MNNNRIKVLHITQVSGGIQTYLEQLFKNIDHTKFEMILACPAERKSIFDMAQKYNINCIELNLKHEISPFSDIKDIYNIVKLVKKVKPHILHSHSSKAGMLTRLASPFFKPVTLYTPNAYAYLGQQGFKRKLLLTIEKIAKPFTDYILAASQSEAMRSINDLKFKDKKVLVFPNSIELLEPDKLSSLTSKQQAVVTMVGRLVKQKNPLMYLEVCKLVTSKRDNVTFRIIGAGFDDQLKAEIEQYIKLNKLEEKIEIIYWMDRNEMLDKIRATEVFVMTSAFESFGYVAAEAQMLEIPVVATNVDGLNEIVKDGETGFLVEPNDSLTMSEKIIYTLDNPEIARDMGRKGRIRVIDKFHIKKNIKILEDIYLNMAKN